MTLADTLRAANYHIVASDLDTQVIATARQAVYPLGAVLKLPESQQKRFFLRGTGRNDGRARVRPEIASHVEFARVNLMDAEWGVEPPSRHLLCATS
jgi:chemotaxis protein methyltransferase CheR